MADTSDKVYDALTNGGKIQAGETIKSTLKYQDAPASAGWTLSVTFRGATDTATIACTVNGTDPAAFDMVLPATTTANWRGGTFAYVVSATLTTDGTYTAERGVMTVLPNPTATTQAMTMLAAVESLLLGRATDDQKTTAIDGVQLQYMRLEQLQQFRATYREIVEQEIRAMGGGGGRYAIQHHAGEDYRLAGPWQGGFPALRFGR
jgi:hypothetical protein